MSKAIVIDTETNNVEDPTPCQVAYAPYKRNGKHQIVFNERYKPATPISAGACAIHKITNKMVEDLDVYECDISPDTYIIGHNIDFDARALGIPDHERRICTLAMARYFYPEWSGHTLGACVIELYGEEKGLQMIGTAHDASADVLSCAYLLDALIKDVKIKSLRELYLLSEKCRIPKKMPFGKHKGKPMDEVPHDYRAWYKREAEADKYILKAWSL